jgi:hypothetical protein
MQQSGCLSRSPSHVPSDVNVSDCCINRCVTTRAECLTKSWIPPCIGKQLVFKKNISRSYHVEKIHPQPMCWVFPKIRAWRISRRSLKSSGMFLAYEIYMYIKYMCVCVHCSSRNQPIRNYACQSFSCNNNYPIAHFRVNTIYYFSLTPVKPSSPCHGLQRSQHSCMSIQPILRRGCRRLSSSKMMGAFT